MTAGRPDWAVRLETERLRRRWGTFRMARELLKAANSKYPSVRSLARMILDWEKGAHFPRDWAAPTPPRSR